MSNLLMLLPSVFVSLALIAICIAKNQEMFVGNFKRLREELEAEALNREALFATPGVKKNAEFKLFRLGFNISYKHFLVLNGLVGLLLAAVSIYVFKNPKLAVVSVVVWMLYAHKMLDLVYEKKVKQPMAEQAELILQLLAEVYEVTKDLIESFKMVTPSAKSPLREEMELFIQDYNLNKDINTCLVEFAERVDNRDIETFARGIILSIHYGTDTYAVLRQTADIIRERRELKEELINETKGRNFTTIIFQLALPVALLFLFIKSPAAKNIFLNTPKGQNLLCVVVAVEFISWYFTRHKGVTERF